MANKVLLKKSSVGARAPVVGDLDYGELALNYADGKLYYKTSGNTIDSYPSATATATLTNKTLSSATLTGSLTAGGGTGTSGQVLQSTGSGVQWANAGSGDVTLTGTQTLTNKTLSSAVITGTLTAGGGVGTNGQVLSSTGAGVQWVNQSSGSTSVFTANARSDLGYVYDSVTITEDMGTPLGTTTISYDLAVLKVDGIVSLDNLDSSVKSDYLAQAIIFGF